MIFYEPFICKKKTMKNKKKQKLQFSMKECVIKFFIKNKGYQSN